MLKSLPEKRTNKQERELKVLFGLVEHYLHTGKPVGSNTLKEAGFDNLSSATIRNYFSQLEENGFLIQLHSSGGRIPTEKAYRFYANELLTTPSQKNTKNTFSKLRSSDTREIAAFLQQAAEELSEITHMAVLLSAPRFDRDFVLDVKLVTLDIHRCLCILITDFGVIRTEVLQTETKLSEFAIKRMERYFHWRLTGQNKPEEMDDKEEQLAQKFYNEVMVRYLVGYSNFIDEELYRTGFSRLLNYPDFDNAAALANGLALFEQSQSIRLLLRECSKFNSLKYWIGSDLLPYTTSQHNCSVIAVPYHINNKVAGAVGILGPMRMPYRELFGIMQLFSECVSEALTRNIYKFKISFRQPQAGILYLDKENAHSLALEDKQRKNHE